METQNHSETYVQSNNFGFQVSVSVPLDGGAVERCKALAQVQIEKARLDYELVRVKECINIYQQGFTIHPSSPFYSLCSDVIPVASLTRSTAEASPEPSPASSEES